MNWISEMFENKGVNKEASNAQEEFTKKVKNSPWISGAMGIDEPEMAKEAEAKIEAELAVRAELTKEAAYEAFQTTEEVLKQDYSRDVTILSDFTLASMIAEMRGHAKQDFPENSTKYFEDAKADVKKDRKAVEKELLDGTGMSAQLDTFKAFADYKKDETPKQATEKELYSPKLEKVDESWADGKAKQADFETTDKARIDGMAGVGREADVRTDVTEQAGEIMKDASLKTAAKELKKAPFAAFHNAEEAREYAIGWQNWMSKQNLSYGELADWEAYFQQVAQRFPELAEEFEENSIIGKESKQEPQKTASLVRDPEVELKVGSIIRLARSIMSHEGQILAEGTNWEITNIDGYHYRLSANGQTHVISSHDTPKFNKIASQKEAGASVGWDVYLNGKKIDTVFYVPSTTADEVKKGLVDHDNYDPAIIVKKEASQEIENHATKEQVLSKIAEISSPWAVVTDKDGKEVVARIADEQVVKQSEEDKKDLSK